MIYARRTKSDSESAPDTTPADELIREVQKAMQSPGDRVQQFTEIFCKAFRLKYKRLSQEERSLLKNAVQEIPADKTVWYELPAQAVEIKSSRCRILFLQRLFLFMNLLQQKTGYFHQFVM